MEEINLNKEKGLTAWSLTMLALGSVIGGSFFIGSSVAIKAAGPSILIAYILGGILVYFILFALSEMTVDNPDSGSFHTFATDAFGRGTGFVLGWVYWTGMVLAMSSEATAVSLLVKEFFPRISIPLLGSGIIISVTFVNLLGATMLSKLESGLAVIKILTILFFIIVAILLIVGLFPGKGLVGVKTLISEPLMPNGMKGLAGSMLIVMFSYAGFEVIGLAASEAQNKRVTIPKAIKITVFALLSLYIFSVLSILLLIPTENIPENMSPIVTALNSVGIAWIGTVINIVLITAILSTMLAAMFGLGRMIRSLADSGLAPVCLKEKTDVPYRGILFSGLFMLIALGIGLLLPSLYMFLISSGGFALLFTYVVIMATHIKYRTKHGKPGDKCRLYGYPYTSLFVLLTLVLAIASMPFVKGQTTGLIAGFIFLFLYTGIYFLITMVGKFTGKEKGHNEWNSKLSMETSNDLTSMKELEDSKLRNKERKENQKVIKFKKKK